MGTKFQNCLKNKENTEYLLHYYNNKGFKILEENNIEYKMFYKN